MEDEQAAIDAVLKFAVLALVVGAVLGLITFVGIKALGVGGGSDTPASSPASSSAPSALPTVALSDPSSASADPSESPSETESTAAAGTLDLQVSPTTVGAGERINLTGTYAGQDNVTLQVQRMDGGAWTPFADVTVPVRVGTFATYILTSRTGEQQFRVFDQGAQKGSNAVTVTVG